MAMRWYIVQAYSGFEKKVVQSIKESAARHNLTHMFGDIVVPTEEVVEVRRGKKTTAERKFFPGYIVIKMDLTDETWHLVKTTDKVNGFLGSSGKPQPISDAEADAIFKQVKEGLEHPKNSIIYEVGENVKVTEGPFESFIGVVEEVDSEKNKVKVAVSIFGRATPVELEFTQVEKVA